MAPNLISGQVIKSRSRIFLFLKPLLVFLASTGLAALAFLLPTKWLSAEFVNARLYIFGTGPQLLMDLLPIVLLVRSGWVWYGSRREMVIGVGVGILGAILLATIRYLLKGDLVFMEQVPAFRQGLSLPMPWNVIASIMTILAYGPGEALFQVYLIMAFDRAVGQEHCLVSLGVILNAFLWGLGHIASVIAYGWSAVGNALLMLVIGIIVGLMYKKTRSATAPVVFWTLINGTSA